jgi:hypothetical protein
MESRSEFLKMAMVAADFGLGLSHYGRTLVVSSVLTYLMQKGEEPSKGKTLWCSFQGFA